MSNCSRTQMCYWFAACSLYCGFNQISHGAQMRLMIAVEVVPANEEREEKKRLIITMICKTNQLPLMLVVVVVVVSPGLGSVVVQRLKTTPH